MNTNSTAATAPTRFLRQPLHQLLLGGLLALACILTAGQARAVPFDDIKSLYFFGDSLTDNGSPFLPPSPPYSGISVSNGPNWADVLGAELGLPTTWGTNNFAVGGAVSADLLAPTSGGQVALGMSQIGAYLASNGGVADPDGLHAIWLGGNDFLSFAPPASIIGNLAAGVGALAAAGADSFLLNNLPDISVSPLVPAGLKPFVRAAIEGYNAALLATSAQLAAALMVDIEVFDVFGLIESARPFLLDAGGLPGIGLGESALRCFDDVPACLAAAPGGDTSAYLLVDNVHPTKELHAALGRSAAIFIPEPATLALLLAGAAAVGQRRMRGLPAAR